MGSFRRVRVSFLLATLLLAACTSPPHQPRDWSDFQGEGYEYFQREEVEFPLVDDPLERTNRGLSALNRGLLRYVADPIASGWRLIMPQPVRSALVRAASNLGYPVRLVNNLLQARWQGAGVETGRFLTNTTVGLLGLFDPARSRWDLRPSPADMGQTFAQWGWTNSTFFTLPLLGPSSLRDGLGTIGDMPLDPTFWLFPAGPAKTFVTGAEHVGTMTDLIETNSDPYQLVRNLWVLSRRGQVRRFEYEEDESSATDTLQNIFFTPDDPRFGRRARSHAVEIPTTGRELRYELWLQRGTAPVVFIVPGLGAHRRSKNAIALAELAFSGGYSVVTISSALNFDFMEHAATTPVPGYAPIDSRDVHVALDAVARDLAERHSGRITRRLLMGMSMGAFHTFFIAADEDSDLVRFDGHVALSPPVRLSHGVQELDGFFNIPLLAEPEEREERIISLLQKVVSLASDGDLEPGNPIPLSPGEAEFIIGVGFRLTLHDMIWTSQQMNDQGVLQHPLNRWRRTPVSREILEYSFMEYVYAFGLPYYRERLPGEIQSADDIFQRSTLQSIAEPLRRHGRIRVVSSANDFLVTRNDVDWLEDLLGAENVYMDERGGHMGNLWEPRVQNAVLDALNALAGGPTSSEETAAFMPAAH